MSEPEQQSSPTGSIFVRHRLALIIGSGVVAFLLLATGALFAGAAVGTARQDARANDAAETPDDSAVDERVVPEQLPASNPIRTCTVNSLAKDERLMGFSGWVTDLSTDNVLFERDGDKPARTASLLKLLTASAVLQVLDPDDRLTTAVYAGDTPGSVVIVGGGDPTLTRMGEGEESYYPGAPKLDDLAEQVLAASDPAVPITRIVLDSTYWDSSDSWLDSWERSEQEIGYHSEVTALQVDGDRKNPKKATSPRSTDPVMNAGTRFAKALGVPNATLELGTVQPGAAELGSVESQPIGDLVTQMVRTSDNTLAESLARVASKESGSDGSAASLQKVVTEQLSDLGLDTEEVTVVDGSGLSYKNAVSPMFMTQLIALLKQGDDNLNVVYNALPVAGETGSLASRFTGDNAVARGKVLAKTGWIETEYSLAGVVNAEDGSSLAFAFYAIGDNITEDAKVALDNLTTAVYACGANLSNR